MSGKSKFILVFSRMQPNFTEQSDANIKKKLDTCFTLHVKISKIKPVLSIFKYRYSGIIISPLPALFALPFQDLSSHVL